MARIALRAVLLVLAVVTLGSTASFGSAASGSAGSAPRLLHLKFHPVTRHVEGLCRNPALTSGGYTLVSVTSQPSSSACASAFMLIDDSSGKRSIIPGSGIADYVLAFGPPWILFEHEFTFELYNITTRESHALDCGNGCPPDGTFAMAIGARWLEFTWQKPGSCGDGIHYSCGTGPIMHSFYNLVTGKFRQDATTTSRTHLDLDSPTLVRAVCPPLRAPAKGAIDFYGPFAVTTQASQSFLERCGSRSRIPIGERSQSIAGGGLVANHAAVLWKVTDARGVFVGRLAGILLPSLRRVSINLPAKVQGHGDPTVLLDRSRLYVAANTGILWSATLPPG